MGANSSRTALDMHLQVCAALLPFDLLCQQEAEEGVWTCISSCMRSQGNSNWKQPQKASRPTSHSKQDKLWQKAKFSSVLSIPVLKNSYAGDSTNSSGNLSHYLNVSRGERFSLNLSLILSLISQFSLCLLSCPLTAGRVWLTLVDESPVGVGRVTVGFLKPSPG